MTFESRLVVTTAVSRLVVNILTTKDVLATSDGSYGHIDRWVRFPVFYNAPFLNRGTGQTDRLTDWTSASLYAANFGGGGIVGAVGSARKIAY